MQVEAEYVGPRPRLGFNSEEAFAATHRERNNALPFKKRCLDLSGRLRAGLEKALIVWSFWVVLPPEREVPSIGPTSIASAEGLLHSERSSANKKKANDCLRRSDM